MLKRMMSTKSKAKEAKDEANRDELFGDVKQNYAPPVVHTSQGSSHYAPPEPSAAAEPLYEEDDPQLQQMMDDAKQKALESKQGTQRCLSIVENTLALGSDTAAKLYNQTTQLEHINGQIGKANNSLDESDDHIKGFTLLGKWTSKAKKLPKPKFEDVPERMATDGARIGAAQDQLKRDELFSQVPAEGAVTKTRSTYGLMSSISGSMGLSSAKSGALTRSASVAPAQSAAAPAPAGPTNVAQLKGIMREQDQDLDKINGALGRMKSLAINMGEELRHQEVLINNIDKHIDYTEARVKDTTRRVTRHL